MLEDVDRMFEGSGPSGFGFARGWSPAIETVERDGRFVLRADLPGLSPDDVRIEVRDDVVVLDGERRSEVEVEEQGRWRSERAYGRFSRAIPLPEGADPEKAEAKFENGVLEVSFPMRDDSSRRRRIEIQGGSKSGSPVH